MQSNGRKRFVGLDHQVWTTVFSVGNICSPWSTRPYHINPILKRCAYDIVLGHITMVLGGCLARLIHAVGHFTTFFLQHFRCGLCIVAFGLSSTITTTDRIDKLCQK